MSKLTNQISGGGHPRRKRVTLKKKPVISKSCTNLVDPIGPVRITIKYDESMENNEKVVLFNKNRDNKASNSLAYHVFTKEGFFCYNTYPVTLDRFTILQDDSNTNYPKSIYLENEEISSNDEPIPLSNGNYGISYFGDNATMIDDDALKTGDNNGEGFSISNNLDDDETSILFLKFIQDGIVSQVSNPITLNNAGVYNPVVHVGEDHKKGFYLGVVSADQYVKEGETAIEDLTFQFLVDLSDNIFPVDISNFVTNGNCDEEEGITLTVSKVLSDTDQNQYIFE